MTHQVSANFSAILQLCMVQLDLSTQAGAVAQATGASCRFACAILPHRQSFKLASASFDLSYYVLFASKMTRRVHCKVRQAPSVGILVKRADKRTSYGGVSPHSA